MKETFDFLKQCNTYYLATTDGDQPKVRPFGTVNIFENKLYIQTGKVKNVYKQIKVNPKIEISGTINNRWIRVEAIAIEDDRIEARQSMLDAYPSLQGMYKVNDGNTVVFYLSDVTTTIFSFSEAPKVFKF
ncbi:hypothetical protein DSECCO2_658400 [anaerobic digester metagenome]